MEILQSPGFWVAISFLCVIAFIVIKARGAVLSSAYDRITQISNEIAESERLREEAQILLTNYEKKYREQIEISNQIIEDARSEAIVVTQHAEKHAEDAITRSEKRAKDAIERAENDATETIRNVVLDKVIEVIKIIASKNVSGKSGYSLIDNAVKDIKLFK